MFYRRLAATLLIVLFAVPAFVTAEHHEEGDAMSDDEKMFYALGMLISGNLSGFDLSAEELAMVQAGMSDSLLGKDTHDVNPMEFQGRLQAMAQERAARIAQKEKDAGRDFLAAQAAAPGAEKTESGLIYTVMREGDGASPQPTDRVKVHYHGTLRDGTVFDSSVDRGEPATFGLNQVIPCWTEGVAMMKVGGKAKLVCPADIAYGDRGAPGGVIKPGAALAFEVELLEILSQ